MAISIGMSTDFNRPTKIPSCAPVWNAERQDCLMLLELIILGAFVFIFGLYKDKSTEYKNKSTEYKNKSTEYKNKSTQNNQF
jgi:hypothetical protein